MILKYFQKQKHFILKKLVLSMLRKKSIIYNKQYSTNTAMVKIKKHLSKIKDTLILKKD